MIIDITEQCLAFCNSKEKDITEGSLSVWSVSYLKICKGQVVNKTKARKCQL